MREIVAAEGATDTFGLLIEFVVPKFFTEVRDELLQRIMAVSHMSAVAIELCLRALLEQDIKVSSDVGHFAAEHMETRFVGIA